MKNLNFFCIITDHEGCLQYVQYFEKFLLKLQSRFGTMGNGKHSDVNINLRPKGNTCF